MFLSSPQVGNIAFLALCVAAVRQELIILIELFWGRGLAYVVIIALWEGTLSGLAASVVIVFLIPLGTWCDPP